MATQRRAVTQQEKAIEQNERLVGVKSDITPAVPLPVIAKLLGFTLAMVTMPISAYFLTRDYVFSGNTTYAGATAAIVANVVLIGYILVAFAEDQSDKTTVQRPDGKKDK